MNKKAIFSIITIVIIALVSIIAIAPLAINASSIEGFKFYPAQTDYQFTNDSTDYVKEVTIPFNVPNNTYFSKPYNVILTYELTGTAVLQGGSIRLDIKILCNDYENTKLADNIGWNAGSGPSSGRMDRPGVAITENVKTGDNLLTLRIRVTGNSPTYNLNVTLSDVYILVTQHPIEVDQRGNAIPI